MPPKADVPRTLVNEKAMRRWLKKAGGDPSAQASGGNPTSSTNERRKKQKLDVRGDAQSMMKPADEKQPEVKEMPTSNQQRPNTSTHVPHAPNPASSTIPPALTDKWWALFNNFEGPEGSDVVSIFDRRFPVEQLICRDFNKKEDRSRVNKAGMRNVGKHLQTMGMQIAFFGYCIDSGLNSLDKELKDRVLKIKELSQKIQSVGSSTQTIIALEKSLLEAKTSLSAAEEASESFEIKLSEIAIQHANDFHKAIAQVQCLNPAVNIEGVRIFKKIVDGKLVDESEDEEE
ncbi:hypothetical protein SESBI_01712 [Sesbania bispinosa]|nr:hypothetical protein SESBI_01712 [Sesbania bispinosa]